MISFPFTDSSNLVLSMEAPKTLEIVTISFFYKIGTLELVVTQTQVLVLTLIALCGNSVTPTQKSRHGRHALHQPF